MVGLNPVSWNPDAMQHHWATAYLLMFICFIYNRLLLKEKKLYLHSFVLCIFFCFRNQKLHLNRILLYLNICLSRFDYRNTIFVFLKKN